MQEVLGGRAPGAADMDRLSLCVDVLLETMRVRPPAYMVGRCAARDTQVSVKQRPPRRGHDSYSIQQGTTALIAPYLLHCSAAFWGPDADEFKPGRWARLRQEGVIGQGWHAALADQGPGHSYMPFGGGPRNCIGTSFAMLEAVIVLAKLLQQWRFEPPRAGAPFPSAAPLITLRPTAVNVRLRRRQRPPVGTCGAVRFQQAGAKHQCHAQHIGQDCCRCSPKRRLAASSAYT